MKRKSGNHKSQTEGKKIFDNKKTILKMLSILFGGKKMLSLVDNLLTNLARRRFLSFLLGISVYRICRKHKITILTLRDDENLIRPLYLPPHRSAIQSSFRY